MCVCGLCVCGGGGGRCVFVYFERVWQEGKIPPKSSRCKLTVLTQSKDETTLRPSGCTFVSPPSVCPSVIKQIRYEDMIKPFLI